MRGVLIALLAVAACAPAPAERLKSPRRIPRVEEPTAELPKKLPKPTSDGDKSTWRAFPRPDIPIDVRIGALRAAMDVSDHLRWPLTPNHHPALEPAYPIAPVFAAAGVGWTDLCKLGAQNRRTSGVPLDQIEYLRAWCEVAKHEPESAVARLAPLLSSAVATMPASVRRDIANIIVDSGDAAHGQRVLAMSRIDQVAMFDLISASYEEVGKTSDAVVFNDLAIDAYTMTKVGDHCHRLAKRVVIAADQDERKVRLNLLDNASTTDTTCRELLHELECWSGAYCGDYMTDHGIDPEQSVVVDRYMSWPTSEQPASFWISYAAGLVHFVGTPGADVLATAALEASLLSLRCVGDRVHEVRVNADAISKNKKHDPTLDDQLDTIIEAPKTLCDHAP